MQSQSNEPANGRDKKKIYFLIVVILILLGINVYLVMNKNKQENKFETVSDEKSNLQNQIERIEMELDNVNKQNVTLNDRLLEEQEMARTKIAALKAALKRDEITQKDLDAARKEILNLREIVKNYGDKIAGLEKENVLLKSQGDSLRTNLKDANQQSESLKQRNQDLSQKVKVGAALKAANFQVTAYKVKGNGKITDVTRAATANRLTINFDVVDNDIAEKGYHAVYLRVIDPAGNVIAPDANIFEVAGQQMQYSKVVEIDYKNDNPSYKIEWDNPSAFVKGTYTLYLYADGYTMGKTQIALR